MVGGGGRVPGETNLVIHSWFRGVGNQWILCVSSVPKCDGFEFDDHWMDCICGWLIIRSRRIYDGSRSIESQARGTPLRFLT
jgi:hypothetical protein